MEGEGRVVGARREDGWGRREKGGWLEGEGVGGRMVRGRRVKLRGRTDTRISESYIGRKRGRE